MKTLQMFSTAVLFLCLLGASPAQTGPVMDLGNRRELFVDRALIDRMCGARLVLHPPRPEEVSLRFDRPWEGRFCAYCTVIVDGSRYRLYYRGLPDARADGSDSEVTCVAESTDGIRWQRPDVRSFEVRGTRQNNAVLANAAPASHNFSPFLDSRPGVPADQRYKALGGLATSGLIGYVSADGIRWRKLRDAPVLTAGSFDSQNVSFWSESEERYVCYFRTFKRVGGVGYRWISRATSPDFLHWDTPVEMSFGDAPPEHLYTNQTRPYFRAPHLYIATAARFMPGRQVLTDEQARATGVHPEYYHDTSDAVLMSSRGGSSYDRTFMEGFIRPGIGPENWVSRTNYPALGIVPTGLNEMSLYVQEGYGQPTAHLRRYSLRLDGFASVCAPYSGGQMVTRPFTFSGKRLALNFASSAAGSIRVEVQDREGAPIPGFALADGQELIGNEIERPVTWKGNLGHLAGVPVRLRFAMKDADLYALQFQ